MLSIQTYTPLGLAPYIKSFWCIKVPRDLAAPYTENILPDGHHEIVFHLNSSAVRKSNGSNDWLSDPVVFFAGQKKKSYVYEVKPGAIIYGVRFYPHTQALFYNFPASLSTDNLLALADVSPTDIIQTSIAESVEKTFTNLEKEFLKKAAKVKKPDDSFLYVDAAVKQILTHGGNVRIDSLEKVTGVSSRYLEKSFQKFVGLSPKQFCSITRYNHFVNYKKNHPDKTLTECAYEAEFYDQSHLINLSRLITGQSPKSYFTRSNYINDFFIGA